MCVYDEMNSRLGLAFQVRRRQADVMNSPPPPAASDRLLKYFTVRPFAAVCAEVAAACQAHRFGLIATVDLKAKLNAKGVPFDRECTVFEVCNPLKAQGVLSLNMDLASALPCRIAIYTEGDRTVLSTMKPTRLLAVYDVPGAAEAAAEVEATMDAIMAQLAG